MSSAALRQQRHRARENAGRLVVSVEVGCEVIELLTEARLLDPSADWHSREEIGAALARFLSLARKA
jgi:hypothetical protein